jgi:PAS domain S-box-containing protein
VEKQEALEMIADSLPNVSSDFEQLLMSLAIRFVNMPTLGMDEGIDRALAITGEFTQVDRSYLMLYDFGRRSVHNTHEWCAEGIDPMIGELGDVPTEGLEDDWIGVHLRGEIVHVPDVSMLPADSALRGILEPQGIITLVAVPMTYEGQCLGFVGFDSVRKQKDWAQKDLTLLRMLAELFTNAEIRQRKAKNIEKARQRADDAEALMGKVLDATGTAIWEMDLNAEFVHMVSGWRRLTGKEWDGKWIEVEEFFKHVHPDDAATVKEILQASKVSSGDSFSAEFRFRNPSGDWRHFQSWWVGEEKDNGKRICLSGGTLDCSEAARSRAEALRRVEMEQCFSIISARFVDTVSFVAAVDAALMDICNFSGAYRASFYVWEEHGSDLRCINQWSNDRLPRSRKISQSMKVDYDSPLVSKLVGGEVIVIPEVRNMDGDLKIQALLLSQGIRSFISAPLLVGGKLEGFITVECLSEKRQWTLDDLGLLRSCAEIFSSGLIRTRAEKVISKSEELHRTILNSLNEIVLMTDGEDRITFINEAWKLVTGHSAEAALGSRFEDLLMSRDVRGQLDDASGDSDAGEHRRFGVCIRAANGANLHFSVSRGPLPKDRGRPSGTLVSLVDVTERNRWEENLIADKINAENANEAKSLYISNLSHELRTPMHGVLGMLELIMKSGVLDQKLQGYARESYASASSLLRLLDDLLDIAKIDRGLVTLSVSAVEIRPMVENLIEMFRRDALSKGLSLDVQIPEDFPGTVLSDSFRIRQILLNLLSNAIKFTDQGSVAIGISLWSRDGTNGRRKGCGMTITVSDTGIGIPDHEIPKLFDPFVQLDSARHRGTDGSGLGLAIVDGIARLMEGELRIESELGVGTRVMVSIPLGDQPELIEAEVSSVKEMVRLDDFSGCRVLVAEDNEINRILAVEHLRSLGCEVSTVTDGRQALDKSLEETFDVVLMDCMMPVMDGFEATRLMLGKNSSGLSPLVIGCTANASEQMMTKCWSVGMRAVLVKPYTREDLVRVLSPALLVKSAHLASSGFPKGPGEKMVPPSLPVLDLAVIEALETQFNDASKMKSRLLDLFHSDVALRITELREAISKGDMNASLAIAHRVKGSAASIGAKRLSYLCGKIETEAHGATGNLAMMEPAQSIGIELAAEYHAAYVALFDRF